MREGVTPPGGLHREVPSTPPERRVPGFTQPASPPQLVFIQVVNGQHLPPLSQDLLLLLSLGLPLPTLALCLRRW